MKSIAASLVLAAAAGSVLADVNPVDFFPPCAVTCFGEATKASSCAATDYVCQCQKDEQTKIADAATPCVLNACGLDVALNKVLPAGEAFCRAVLAAPPPAPPSAPPSPPPADTSAPAPPPADTSAPAPPPPPPSSVVVDDTTTAAPANTCACGGGKIVTVTTTTSVPAPSANPPKSNYTGGRPPPVTTNGGSSVSVTGSLAGLAVLVMAAVFAL